MARKHLKSYWNYCCNQNLEFQDWILDCWYIFLSHDHCLPIYVSDGEERNGAVGPAVLALSGNYLSRIHRKGARRTGSGAGVYGIWSGGSLPRQEWCLVGFLPGKNQQPHPGTALPNNSLLVVTYTGQLPLTGHIPRYVTKHFRIQILLFCLKRKITWEGRWRKVLDMTHSKLIKRSEITQQVIFLLKSKHS